MQSVVDGIRGGVKKSVTDNLEIQEESNEKPKSQEHSISFTNSALLICGSSVPLIFEKEELIELFAQILPNMKSIIVYRSSPA